MSFIKKMHSEPYLAISPLRPEVSQAGQTVLITGGAQGVGYSISKAFAQAGASTIVIASRRLESIKAAITRIKADVPAFSGQVIAHTCDVSDLASIEQLWNTLKKEGRIVDVLVINAADARSIGTLIDEDLQQIWAEFNANVRGTIDLAQRFFKQNKASPNGHKKALLNLSTFAIYDFNIVAGKPNYSLTKNAGTLAIQQIAKDIFSEEMQIVSFHPGAIWTDASRSLGIGKEDYTWDDDDLPGAFAVWAASPEAQFMHGRYVESRWDVEELKNGEVAKRIEDDPYFLKVGVHGLAGAVHTVI